MVRLGENVSVWGKLAGDHEVARADWMVGTFVGDAKSDTLTVFFWDFLVVPEVLFLVGSVRHGTTIEMRTKVPV